MKKASHNSVVIAEYRLLNALVNRKVFREDPRISIDLFVDEIAKSVYEAIMELDSLGSRITQSSLLQASTNIDFNVNDKIVNTIFTIEESVPDTLDDILKVLNTAHLKQTLLGKVNSIKDILSQAGEFDSEDILSKLYDIDTTLQNNVKGDSPLMNFEEWSNLYLEDLEQRKSGKKYSFGDPLLDEAIFKGAYPGAITTIAGSTGMGKSAYALSLADNLLENNVPVMYCSLEMSAVDQFDRLLAKRRHIESRELYRPENAESLIEEVRNELENLKDRNRFYFCEEPDLSIVKLEGLIKEFKQKTKSDYVLVIVDLLTQLKDFMNSKSGNTAVSMELAMNRLNALAKAQNCHIIGIVQFRRQADSGKIYSVEEISNLRPQLGDVKNSGGIAERSRVLLSVFRPKYYADRYLKDDPAAELMDDVMEVQILKNSSGESGQIFKYDFIGSNFQVIPRLSEEEDAMNKLKDLDY